ncbi:unnamed protein product [Urochloa decumbens]|uniref:Uncharacterized protein n=1 Tax=Urochloa decumbens TaxID=240449 RepID=A0ABC9E4G8_9POAL
MAEKMSKPAAPLAVVSMDKDSSSPLPASSMDNKKPQPPSFAVVLDVKSSPPPPVPMVKKEKPPAVMMVCLWALLNAVIFAGCSIADLIMNRKPCTSAAAAAVAVAFLLTGRRRRSRSRCRWAWALAVVSGDAYITTDIVLGFVFALLDLIGFLCLLILGDGHDE